MKSNKKHRLETNPVEKVFHDQFIEMFTKNGAAHNMLSAIVFGWSDDKQRWPKQFLTDYEQDICLNTIQWLGSPVGQSFLNNCGFVPKTNN